MYFDNTQPIAKRSHHTPSPLRYTYTYRLLCIQSGSRLRIKIGLLKVYVYVRRVVSQERVSVVLRSCFKLFEKYYYYSLANFFSSFFSSFFYFSTSLIRFFFNFFLVFFGCLSFNSLLFHLFFWIETAASCHGFIHTHTRTQAYNHCLFMSIEIPFLPHFLAKKKTTTKFSSFTFLHVTQYRGPWQRL